MKISFPAPTSRLTTVLCALLLHVLSSSSSLQLPSPSQSQSQSSSSSSSPGVVFSAAYDKSRADFFNGNSTYAKLVRLATADRRSKRTKRRQEQRRRREKGHETGGAEEGGGGGTVVVGDREAQWKLGAMLVRGRFVERNMVEAEQWWRLAAEQGHPEAQYQLAHLYHLNQGHMTR